MDINIFFFNFFQHNFLSFNNENKKSKDEQFFTNFSIQL